MFTDVDMYLTVCIYIKNVTLCFKVLGVTHDYFTDSQTFK